MLLLGEGLQALINIFLTHCFRYFIIRFKWLNFKLPKLIPLVLIAVTVISVLAAILLVTFLLAQSGFTMPEGVSPIDITFLFISQMVVSGVSYSIWALGYFVYLYIERYNNSLKYEAAVRETELKNLKDQLNPHFIFNALNSIRALVDENPNKSKEAITQLSHILRNSLNSDRQKLVPFAEEFRTVKDYLGLESIRFEERLNTNFEIAPGTNEFQMPPLMLQTLVENGIKHGIAKLKEGGTIDLKTQMKDEYLLVQIRNTGQLQKNQPEREGFGLANTIRRLEMIYGDQASFSIKNENQNTVLTELTLPK